jgi:hypothetical protein
MRRVEVEHQGQRIEIPIGETVVGRDSGCALRFTDASVSRKHMRFVRRNGELFVEDLGSANGIEVNGRRIAGSLRLVDGDALSFGRLTFTVRVVESEDFETTTDINARSMRGFVAEQRDRRRHERRDVELRIVYLSSELEIEVISRDLSESGVFVQSPLLDPIGTACTLMMQGVTSTPLKLSGVVRRIVDRKDTTGLGVEFVGLASGERALIRSICERVTKSRSPSDLFH